MLERAMPVDALPGSTIPERTEAQVQLQDGSWIWCEVIGQRKDRQRRWCVGIRWYASPSVGGREGWYVLDDSRIRRFSTLASDQRRPPSRGQVDSRRHANDPQECRTAQDRPQDD